MKQGINLEIQNRIRLSTAAYMYEYYYCSIMSDAEFDELAKRVNPNVATGNKLLDDFFKEKFHPDTGMWITEHPEKEKLEARCRMCYPQHF